MIVRMEKPAVPVTATERLHQVTTVVVALLFGIVVYQTVTNPSAALTLDWPLQALMLAAAFNTLTAQARQLRWQYVLSAAFFAMAIGGGAHLLSASYSIPFGPFMFGKNAGPATSLPWTVPVLWVVALFNARGVARLILRPWRKMKTYGFWLIGITAALSMVFDVGMDPFLSRLNHYWMWSPTKLPLTWEGAPLINFLGWLFVSLLILAFATPLLIKKQPGQKSVSDYHPLGLWCGAMILFGTAAALHGSWVVTGVDAAAVVAVMVPAIRGGRW